MWDRLKTLSLSIRILLGLALGAVIGLVLPSTGRNEGVDQFVEAAAIGGKLWLQALQMTILPLVFGLVATLFIRSRGLTQGTGNARRAFYVMMAFYLLAIPIGIFSVEVYLGAFPVTDGMAQALRSMAGEGVPQESLHWQDSVLSLVPVNIISAMAGPSMLPGLFFVTNAYLLWSSLAYTGRGALLGVAVLAVGGLLLIPLDTRRKETSP